MDLHHWDIFYRNGFIATGPTQKHGNYELENLQTWQDFFEKYPTNTRILDIATGNGAVASIANKISRNTGKDFEIHACDLAQINPMHDVPNANDHLAGITFYPGLRVESLHFEDSYFDAVCGQYALEYTNIPESLTQLHRIMKVNSLAQFIIHHNNSVEVNYVLTALNEADFVLHKTKIYRRLKNLVTTHAATPKFAENAGIQLRASIQSLKRAVPKAQATGGGKILLATIDNIQRLLNLRTETDSIAVLDREINLAENQLRYWVRRQKDLLSCAKNENGMSEIESKATSAGFSVVSRDLQFQAETNLVGWKLVLQRV